LQFTVIVKSDPHRNSGQDTTNEGQLTGGKDGRNQDFGFIRNSTVITIMAVIAILFCLLLICIICAFRKCAYEQPKHTLPPPPPPMQVMKHNENGIAIGNPKVSDKV
ncbi:hypothetical protein Ciccas_014536, partial [Cichlidogyrus casuarinus]